MVDFDPVSGTDNYTANGGADGFVLKLDANGNYQWAAGYGSNRYDYGKGISTDASGNVFTTGYYYGSVDFDPATGTVPTAPMTYMTFLCKNSVNPMPVCQVTHSKIKSVFTLTPPKATSTSIWVQPLKIFA